MRWKRLGIAYGCGLLVGSAVAAETLPRSPAVFFHKKEAQPDSIAIGEGTAGQTIAYSVRYPAADFDQARSDQSLFLENGTPLTAVGSSVYTVDPVSRVTRQVCPGAGEVWSPSWSPDGRRLAVYGNADDVPAVWIHNAETAECRRISDTPLRPKYWPGGGPLWSPDGNTLYVPLPPSSAADVVSDQSPELSSDGSGLGAASVATYCTDPVLCDLPSTRGTSGNGTAYQVATNHSMFGRMELGTGRVTPVVSEEPMVSVANVSPSGRWLSLLSVPRQPDPNVQALVFDLFVKKTDGLGEPIPIASGLPRPWQDPYRQSYRWSGRADLLTYVDRGAVWLVDLRRGAPRPRRLSRHSVPYSPRAPYFNSEGDQLVVALAGGNAFHLLSLSGEVAAEIKVDAEQWAFEHLITDSSGAAWQTSPDSIVVQMRSRATGESAIIRLRPGGAERVIWRGHGTFSNLTAVPEANWLVGFYQDYQTPLDMYRFSADFGVRERLTAVEPRLEQLPTRRVHRYETLVPAHDGSFRLVRTAVILPAGVEPGDRPPAIVTLYPGYSAADLGNRYGGGEGVDGIPPALYARRGYAVILPDMPTGSGDEPGNIIDEMRDVLLPQLYRAHELGLADVSRLGVRGNSFGAFAAAGLLSATNLFRAGSVSNGPYDLSGPNYSAELDAAGIAWTETGGQARLGTHPWADLRRYIENSPYYRADRINAPMLILQGGSDSYRQEAQMLYGALQRLGKCAELAIYENSGHWIGAWPLANAIDAFERLIRFWDFNLRAQQPSEREEAVGDLQAPRRCSAPSD